MRAGFHFVSILVVNCQNLCRNIASVGFHYLDFISYAELVLLLDIYGFAVRFIGHTKINVFVNVCVVVVYLRLFGRLSKIKARRKLSVCALGNL